MPTTIFNHRAENSPGLWPKGMLDNEHVGFGCLPPLQGCFGEQKLIPFGPQRVEWPLGRVCLVSLLLLVFSSCLRIVKVYWVPQGHCRTQGHFFPAVNQHFLARHVSASVFAGPDPTPKSLQEALINHETKYKRPI